MNDGPYDFADDDADITPGENVLYLMVELDCTLERGVPAWTPAQAKVVRRLVGSLSAKLATVAAKS